MPQPRRRTDGPHERQAVAPPHDARSAHVAKGHRPVPKVVLEMDVRGEGRDRIVDQGRWISAAASAARTS